MKSISTKSRLKQSEFKRIHELSALGLSQPIIAEVTGRSLATITRALQQRTWEGYQTFLANMAREAREATERRTAVPGVVATHLTETLDTGKGKGRKHIKRIEYHRIKQMLEAGLSHRQIRDITGRSVGSVARVRASKNFKDFRMAQARYSAKQQSADKPNMPTATIVPTPAASTPLTDEALLVLRNLADALNKQTQAYDKMADKLDEVLETKRPWVSRLRN